MRKFGVQMLYEDVFQDVCVGYCEAAAHFDPQRGFAFTTYFFRTARNEFYREHGHLLKQHQHMPTVSMDETVEGQKHNFHEVVKSAESESAEEKLIREEVFHQNLTRLSPIARVVMRQIESPSPEITNAFTARKAFAQEATSAGEKSKSYRVVGVSMVCKALGFNRVLTAKIRKEIETKCQLRA